MFTPCVMSTLSDAIFTTRTLDVIQPDWSWPRHDDIITTSPMSASSVRNMSRRYNINYWVNSFRYMWYDNSRQMMNKYERILRIWYRKAYAYPSCLQITIAALWFSGNLSLHTVPHTPSWCTSTRPDLRSISPALFTSLTSEIMIMYMCGAKSLLDMSTVTTIQIKSHHRRQILTNLLTV